MLTIEGIKKNLIYALQSNFNFLKLGEEHNYAVKKEDFVGFERKVYELIDKAKKEGYTYIPDAMYLDNGITRDELNEYFTDIIFATEENVHYYFKRLAEEKARETGIQEMEHLTQLFSSSEDVDSVFEHLKKRATQLKKVKKVKKGLTLLEIGEMEKAKKESVSKVPTGIKEIDDALDGGFSRSALNTITGKSGEGKTTIASQMIAHMTMVENLKVDYVNLELTNNNVFAKMAGLLSGEGYQFHDTGSIRFKNDIHARNKMIHDTQELIKKTVGDNFQVYKPESDETMADELIQYIIQRDQEGCDAIFIDYFQIIQHKFQKKNEGLDDFISRLNALKSELNMAIVILAQLNEKKEGHAMELDIFWSQSLKKYLDIEIRVFREKKEDSDEFTPFIHVGFVKVRFNEKLDSIPFAFDGNRIGSLYIVERKVTKEEIDAIRFTLEKELGYEIKAEPFLFEIELRRKEREHMQMLEKEKEKKEGLKKEGIYDMDEFLDKFDGTEQTEEHSENIESNSDNDDELFKKIFY